MVRIAVFALISVPILWVSRRSLGHPASHGFFRFFAFEAVLALLLLNAPRWFVDPFGVPQLISWFLLSLSLLFVTWGFALLRRLGGFSLAVEASPSSDRGSTGRLVTTGIYRYIRHPLYSSLLFLAWGAVLKSITVGSVLLGVATSLALTATARSEEVENMARFGHQYREYMSRTRRFVPFLY